MNGKDPSDPFWETLRVAKQVLQIAYILGYDDTIDPESVLMDTIDTEAFFIELAKAPTIEPTTNDTVTLIPLNAKLEASCIKIISDANFN